jgi:hypothetical protein
MIGDSIIIGRSFVPGQDLHMLVTWDLIAATEQGLLGGGIKLEILDIN